MIGSILVFILVLSLLVLVHEAGHFYVAKRAGVWVEEFGFGLPPKIWGKKKGDTIYSINLFPFGGFVRLHGENLDERVNKPEKAFLNKSLGKRAQIVLAGVFMNFVLAIVAFGIFYSFSGIPRKIGEIAVVEVFENTPASEAGIEPGDRIVSVSGISTKDSNYFMDAVQDKLGQEIEIEVKKENGDLGSYNLIPRTEPPEGEGALGVVITDSEIYFPPIWQRPFVGAFYGVKEALVVGWIILAATIEMILMLFTGTVPQGVAGPVGIYALTSEAAKLGLLSLVNFVGVLSINLAVLNVLPIPALDGGRLLFIFFEKLFGKKVLPKVEAWVHTVGIIFLLGLILVITAVDIKRLVVSGSVAGYIESIIPK